MWFNRHRSPQFRIPTSPIPFWLFQLKPHPSVFNAEKALATFLRKKNVGFGLILINDITNGTKAIKRGQTVPNFFWTKLKQLIINADKKIWGEKQVWYDTTEDHRDPADFLLNGNKAHQYVPQSDLSIAQLEEHVKKCFTIVRK